MSWESSLEYYRVINEEVKRKLGWHNSARIIMTSVNFEVIKNLQFAGKWSEAWEMLAQEAKILQGAWADMVLLCTNTMHKVAAHIEQAITVPFLHIADGTGERIRQAWYKKIALLWTAFTMEHDFYKNRLIDSFWLEVVVPNEEDRKIVHSAIYDELCLWVINPNSRQAYIRIINSLKDQGCECVILGCTEICLLINEEVSSLPVFDTTRIHAEYAVDLALT